MAINISQETSNQTSQWTNLNDPRLMEQFVKKFSDLLKVSPEKRNDELQKIINQILGATGTPSINKIAQGNFAQNGSGNQATFDSEEWRININFSRISQLNLSNAGKLSRLIYHEMRHAEQSYRIAQWLSSPPNSKNFQEIRKITNNDIEDNVIKQAIKSVSNYEKLSTTQKQQIAQAEYWYDSLYGKNIQNSHGKYIKGPLYRIQVLDDLNNEKILEQTRNKAEVKYKLAHQAFLNAKKNSSTPVAKLQRLEQLDNSALREFNEAKSRYSNIVPKYEALPEEADAYRTSKALPYPQGVKSLSKEEEFNFEHRIFLDSQVQIESHSVINSTQIPNKPEPNLDQAEQEQLSTKSLALQRYEAIAVLLKEAGLEENTPEWNESIVQVAIETGLKSREIKDIAHHIPGFEAESAERAVNQAIENIRSLSL